MVMLTALCVLALAGQDAPYTADELAALRKSVDELVRAGKLVPAAAKLRELKAERIPPGELENLQALDRRIGAYAALLLETTNGALGEIPRLSRVVTKGGGKLVVRVIRQDAKIVLMETMTGIRSRMLKEAVDTVTALTPAEGAAEVQKEFKNQYSSRFLVLTSEPGKPPAWKEVGKQKASGASLFAVADFAARNGLGEYLASLFDLAVQRDPKLRDAEHVARGERLVNQLLNAMAVNQLPLAEQSLGQLTSRYRDTASYRDRVHGDKELGEVVQVILKKELPPPVLPEEPKPLAGPAPVVIDVPAPAAPAPDPEPVDRTIPVTSRKLPEATAPDVLALVLKGDAAFDQAMKHLLDSDSNENPSGWTQENAKALELFTKANQECYLPAQEKFGAGVPPQPLLDRVREATLRSSLCRKRSVRK